MQNDDDDDPALTTALTTGKCLAFCDCNVAWHWSTGSSLRRGFFSSMVQSRAGTSSVSSLATVMSSSYLNHILDVLQLLSHHPSYTAVSVPTLRFLINNTNNWNSIGDDDSSVDRICIEGVTGETISHLVASALNAMATLQRFPLEHWATPFYNAVALESQEELVVDDDDQESLQNSAL